MLDHLKRFFTPAEGKPEMAQEETQASVLDVDNTAELATALASLATQAEAIAELTAKYEAAQAQLAEIESAKANLVAEQLAVKMQARKDKVVSLIGTVKAPALLSATESLDDTSFETVVAAMQVKVEQESKSELFTEIGASVDSEQVQESGIASLIKSKYNK